MLFRSKLLAAENIAVEHAPVVTASFDVKNRVLRLPMWQEMTESLYHLLVLHEVGHALETPCDGWKGAIDAVEESDGRRVSRTFQGYLNVVEDARIERKIKAKFPGSRRDFHDGYKWLFESDFFNVKSTKPDELSTIDRINLYFKVGSHMQVPFSDAEQVFVKRTEDIHTWDEAVQLATDLLAFAKEKAEQEEEDLDEEKRDVSTRTLDDDDGEEGDDWEDAEELGDEGESKSGDGDETEEDGYKSKGRKQSNGMIEEATTDKALSDKMQDLVDPAMLGRELRYVVLPKDIGFIKPGQRARVKITAYDYAIFGAMEGRVINIGADAIANEKGEAFYQVRIETQTSAIEALDKKLAIIAGMQAQIDIVTGQKTVLQFLSKPLVAVKENAFRER